MRSVIDSMLSTLRAPLRDRAALQLEILTLHHQLEDVRNGRSSSNFLKDQGDSSHRKRIPDVRGMLTPL